MDAQGLENGGCADRTNRPIDVAGGLESWARPARPGPPIQLVISVRCPSPVLRSLTVLGTNPPVTAVRDELNAIAWCHLATVALA